MLPSSLRQVSPDKTRTGHGRFTQHHAHCRNPSHEEMRAVFRMCRGNQWNSVLNSIRSNRLIQTTNMTMDNNITTTIIHQAITSKGDISKRAMVIQEILQVTPHAASIKNGYGSLPLHVICQRNVKMNSAKKEKLIRDLINAYPMSLTVQGGVGKRTPLHIIFTDYVSVGVTELMIQRGRGACFMSDKNGFLPAHVACSRHCSPEKLEMLLKVNPASLFEKTKDGRTLLDLARCKATKSHPNYALITDIERRVKKMASVGVCASAAMLNYDTAPGLVRNGDFLHHNSISFDSATESTANNTSPFSQEVGIKQENEIKQENDYPAGSTTTTNNSFPAESSASNDFLSFSERIAIKRENESSDGDDSRKKIKQEDTSDPATLLLHFSRHTENIASV
eukprot:CAMPEP_0172401904 /NCGR_PEP_ID=MMETSP1061-20121228/52490_1 /TAXON_ID=37318 /ORGANISM="Pseudo-nitzschia pungens, Strain cf. pungens" /LENGTH=393 /DNA_ID=CAMNT_0013135715 /DNA_START=841 /DNA_END=2022 /DNA_ORIENTATION=+